jgi:tRNA (guanine-N7-)-methyltransferase
VGEDGSGAGAEGSVRALGVKPPPDRLYGRVRGHALRPRQLRLLDLTLPRIAFRPDQAAAPMAAFGPVVRALWVEVGAGGGEHALAQASTHPQAAVIACEVYVNGICSLLSRLVPAGAESVAPLPPNLRLWPDDGRVLLRLLPEASVDRLFLLFPDPWPKARHAKRRFVHPALLPVLARALRPGGEWRIATDDPTYGAWIAEVMGGQHWFASAAVLDKRPADWPPTRYEAKALSAGRAPRYWSFIRS